MPPRTRLATGLLALALAAGLAACSGGAAGADAAPAGPATPTAEAPALPTEAGAAVPADQVDAVLASGGFVYVAPDGDGSGVVVRGDQPFPQPFLDALTRAYTPYVGAAGATPSEDTIAAAASGQEAARYRAAVDAAGGVPLGLIFPFQCLGEAIDPDNPGEWEVYYETEEEWAAARWSYHLCTTQSWSAGVQGVEGFDDFNRSLRGFDSLDSARAALQPMVDANPGLQVVVIG